MQSSTGGLAVIIGATGGIGAALIEELKRIDRFALIVALARKSDPPLDILDEASIRLAAGHISTIGNMRLVIDATGVLHGDAFQPEKSWRSIDPVQMAHVFAVNAIGPALLMKFFLPLLPKAGKSVFATLSAKVGSIGDNRLGGWYSYRASKAALNQLVRTAAIELARTRPEAVCVAIHPGTVATALSEPFAKDGLAVSSPGEAALRILRTIDLLEARDTGNFIDANGARLPW